jgi:hypothetical protein
MNRIIELFNRSEGDQVDKHLFLDDIISYLDHSVVEIRRSENKEEEDKNYNSKNKLP